MVWGVFEIRLKPGVVDGLYRLRINTKLGELRNNDALRTFLLLLLVLLMRFLFFLVFRTVALTAALFFIGQMVLDDHHNLVPQFCQCNVTTRALLLEMPFLTHSLAE